MYRPTQVCETGPTIYSLYPRRLKSLTIYKLPDGCNKVVIELHVGQFWSEIILVISNRTRAARSFDFEIPRMISGQIALHLVQLSL